MRWISRDPLAEQSFWIQFSERLSDSQFIAMLAERLKPEYAFVSNDPTLAVDTLGLSPSRLNIKVPKCEIWILTGHNWAGSKCCELYSHRTFGRIVVVRFLAV